MEVGATEAADEEEAMAGVARAGAMEGVATGCMRHTGKECFLEKLPIHHSLRHSNEQLKLQHIQ